MTTKEERVAYFAAKQKQKDIRNGCILELKDQGCTNSEIAERMQIPESTVMLVVKHHQR